MRDTIYDIRDTIYERRTKNGVTLVEMLIVVAIIALLTTLVITTATRIENQSREKLTANTIAILTAALSQFRDYGYNYKIRTGATPEEIAFYRSLSFPPDCYGYPFSGSPNFDLETTLENALGASDVLINAGAAHDDPNYSGGEALYLFLSQLSECRKTVSKIDLSLITNEDSNKNPMTIVIEFPDGSRKEYPLLRIIDPWGETLRYDCYDRYAPFAQDQRKKSKRTFPLITSAGPDRIFGTADDITSKD